MLLSLRSQMSLVGRFALPYLNTKEGKECG